MGNRQSCQQQKCIFKCRTKLGAWCGVVTRARAREMGDASEAVDADTLPKMAFHNEEVVGEPMRICHYATIYPEAFPLREVTAKQIATAMLRLFSQLGIPREVLTDQGPNFMSRTLKQVYQLLGIRRIRTTPYHP